MLALGGLMFDILFTMSLPLTGFATGALLVVATTVALLQVPGIHPALVVAVM